MGEESFREVSKLFIIEATARDKEQQDIAGKYAVPNNAYDEYFHNSLVAWELGFDHVNMAKHGWDAYDSGSNAYLEIKNSYPGSKSITGTFNDTSDEKLEAMESGDVFIALAVWESYSDIDHIVYGNATQIVDYLRERRDNSTAERNHQTISESQFLEHGFEYLYPQNLWENVTNEQQLESC